MSKLIQKAKKITLPNGSTLADAVVIPYGLEKLGSFQSEDVFQQLSSTRRQPVTEEIPLSENGLDPVLITGDHPALHYRGNKLKRHKIWAQTEYMDGLLKYGYTGWQHAVAAATRDVACYPILDMVMHSLNLN